jgi:hypothetical protein
MVAVIRNAAFGVVSVGGINPSCERAIIAIDTRRFRT